MIACVAYVIFYWAAVLVHFSIYIQWVHHWIRKCSNHKWYNERDELEKQLIMKLFVANFSCHNLHIIGRNVTFKFYHNNIFSNVKPDSWFEMLLLHNVKICELVQNAYKEYDDEQLYEITSLTWISLVNNWNSFDLFGGNVKNWHFKLS